MSEPALAGLVQPPEPPQPWHPPPSMIRQAAAILRTSKLFWAGLVMKVVASCLFGSHFATQWFAPFLYFFVHSGFANPWAHFEAAAEPQAFPYGPGMLGILSLSWFPALCFDFNPAGHLGLLLLRLPLICADLVVLVLLMRWLRVHTEDAVRLWWLNPIVFYATYVHGQLDLLPTALMCGALYFMFSRRMWTGALLVGLALATKGHLLLCVPFLLVFVHRQRLGWVLFVCVTLWLGGGPYLALLPLRGFRSIVFGSAEFERFWAVVLPFGPQGSGLYLCLAALTVVFLRFASYRRVDRDLTFTYIGTVYLLLVTLTPPQPGWFIWALPFAICLAARLTRTGRVALDALAVAYLLYFFVSQPETFLEAVDPTLGPGFGHALTLKVSGLVPQLFSPRAAGVSWSLLFAVTVMTAFEMYRVGVRGSDLHDFLDTTFMIGIGGDSGAGKHTISQDLAALLGAQYTAVNGDDDHRWERGHAMWRQHTHLDPRANHLIAQVEAVAALRRGAGVLKRQYDHENGRFTGPVRVEPTPFVAIVGLHPFYLEQQRNLLHLKLFVDTDEALRRAWKVARDVAKRGYASERAGAELDRREEDSTRFVRPQARYADVVVRHLSVGSEVADEFVVEVELRTALKSLDLLEVLSQAPGLSVEWGSDGALTRETLAVRGRIEPSTLNALASAAIPHVEEMIDASGWRHGGRGVVQLVLLHALSARLQYNEQA